MSKARACDHQYFRISVVMQSGKFALEAVDGFLVVGCVWVCMGEEGGGEIPHYFRKIQSTFRELVDVASEMNRKGIGDVLELEWGARGEVVEEAGLGEESVNHISRVRGGGSSGG